MAGMLGLLVADRAGGAAAAPKKDPALHWGFKTPVRPATPRVANPKFKVRNPIDAFILAGLEREKLGPSPEAGKAALLRRVSLDLIGLPPTPQEVDDFLADKSPDAYEKQVERLLASPHYGERWARHWLDAARYADSDGFEKDMSREVWPYRDYVIQSFNHDLPYDQFIIEQLAGDQLPNATQDQIVATGFLRNSMVNMEGAIDPEQFRMEGMFDRMDCIGKAVLGLTIQCAQCHNHKFDPLTQEEYYKIFAYINSDHESRPAVYLPEQQMKVAALRREMKSIEEDLQHRVPDWRERMRQWEASVAGNQPEWIIFPELNQEGEKSQRYEDLKDGSYRAAGYAPTKMTEYFRLTNDVSGVTAFRLEILTDPNLPYGGPGRAFNGTFALTEFIAEAIDAKNPTNKSKVKFVSATSDFDQPERALEANFYDKSTNSRVTGPVSFAIDGKANTAWGVNAGPVRRNQDRKAVFVADKPAGYPGGTIWRIGLQQNHGGWNSDDHMNNNLGRFRISATRATGEVRADPLPKKVREILALEESKRSAAQLATVFSYWRSTLTNESPWREANAKIESLWHEWPEAASTLTLQTRAEPRETSLLKRGDWLKPVKPVVAGVPAFLHPLPKDAPATRLTFARWTVDKKSPTTARSFVNRIWQQYFGFGIVNTPEDFGMQSDTPSNRELLDWLACEFMQPQSPVGSEKPTAWSVKHMHRLIATSSAYRQSSRVTPELYERDPQNRLLARGPRFRVEGEIVRDIALSASGLLNPKIGGRSVMPPAPAFLFQPPASYAPFPWKDEEGSEKYRRALYTFRRRSTAYPALQTFDVPNADQSCVRRQRSNSPLQALVSLNEPIFVECSRALGRKILEEGGATDADRLNYAFRRVLGRLPGADESAEMVSLLEKERRRLGEGWLNPSEVATGDGKLPGNLPVGASPTQLAAYTVVARVLLNLDETITKE